MTDFVELVTQKSGRAQDEVRTALHDNGIEAYTPRPAADRLRLTRLWFAGVRDPDAASPTDAFEFEWNFNPGVQAIASVRNSVGKTSVLEICRWMLTGRSHHAVGGLDPLVRKMLHRVRLEFTIGEDDAAIELDARSTTTPGSLEIAGQRLSFTATTMEQVVGALMLDRLQLRPMVQFARAAGSSRGTVVEHGWLLLSGALLVGPTHLDAVIGTVPNEAGRVLQVYMGLPWFETLSQARAAQGDLRQALGDRQRAAQAESKVRTEITERLRHEFEQAEQELQILPSEQVLAADLNAAVAQLGTRNAYLAAAEASALEAKTALDDATSVQVHAQRELATAREHQRASVFFRALQPVACPRCDGPIDNVRLVTETEDHTCSVCTREYHPEVDPDAIARAEGVAEEAKRAYDAAAARSSEAQAAVGTARQQRDQAQTLVTELAGRRDSSARQRKLLEVERLRGRLDERAAATAVAENPVDQAPVLSILEAAVAAADELVGQQAYLFDDLNARILQLGQRFGISDMTSTKLDRAAHLPVWKGETKYNYRDLSEGEQLRLKVAVVVALLEMAGSRRLGHHPGLLIVDSPGAQEVGAEPLQAMLETLRDLAEAQDLQVLVATARRDEAVAALGADRVRQPATADDALW